MRHSFLHRADASNGKGANRNERAEKRKRKAANYEYGGADKTESSETVVDTGIGFVDDRRKKAFGVFPSFRYEIIAIGRITDYFLHSFAHLPDIVRIVDITSGIASYFGHGGNA